MSNGDFGAELQQSVSEHLEEVRRRLSEAKARIADGIAGIAPPAPPEAQPPQPDSANEPSRRYNVSFDDVPGDAWEDPA